MRVGFGRPRSRGPGVFINYRRSEAQHLAGRLRDSLSERLGAGSVFMDIDDIAAGTDFVNVIGDALQSCSTLLLLMGPGWLDTRDSGGRRRLDDPNDYVRLEIFTALAQGVQIIPVLFDGASMPTAAELPPELAELSRRQAVQLTAQRWQSSVGEIVAAVKRDFRNQLGPLPLRVALAASIAVLVFAGAVGVRSLNRTEVPIAVGHGPVELPPADPATPVALPRVEVKSTGLECNNSYLGYSVNVPVGLHASGDDDPFVNCEAFDFADVKSSKYKDEDIFTVPILFKGSTQTLDSLRAAVYEATPTEHVVTLAGTNAVVIEYAESGRSAEHVYTAVIGRGRWTLVAQLALPVSRGLRNWRNAKSLMNEMLTSLQFTDITQCSTFHSRHCGDFYWIETPSPLPASVRYFTPRQITTTVNQPVEVKFAVDDPDTNDIKLTSENWGDDSMSALAVMPRMTGGPSLYEIVRDRPYEPDDFGPWPPPEKHEGHEGFYCAHRYAKPGTYSARFTTRSRGAGDDVPRHGDRDPYLEYRDVTTTIVVNPAPSTTEEAARSSTSSTTSSTTSTTSPPAAPGSSCRTSALAG